LTSSGISRVKWVFASADTAVIHADAGQPRPSSDSTRTVVTRSASRPPNSRGVVIANAPAARNASTLARGTRHASSAAAACAASTGTAARAAATSAPAASDAT